MIPAILIHGYSPYSDEVVYNLNFVWGYPIIKPSGFLAMKSNKAHLTKALICFAKRVRQSQKSTLNLSTP